MAQIIDIKQGNFISTMLISKIHKRENYKLSTNLKYTLMHPNLSKIPYSIFSYSMILLKIVSGLFFALITFFIIPNIITLFLGFVFGYIIFNEIVERYFNKPKASVNELNTFLIASKIIDPHSNSNFKTTDARVTFENKIKFLHDSYKNEIFSIINSEVKKDYELKYSIKILRALASEIDVQFDKDSVEDLYIWVSKALENIYKGTRISYWDNRDGRFRLVITNLAQEREFIETKQDLSGIIDELNLLIFSNHYKDVIGPLFAELSSLVKPLVNKEFYREFTNTNQYNENSSECLRVLLSKTLGMQEVLKMTRRQFERLNEAKKDLEDESKDIHSLELDNLIKMFSSNGSMENLLNNLQDLAVSLSEISKNLRSLNFDEVARPFSEKFRSISDLYFSLEKLRLISTWFEDIASYTNISGGSFSDIVSTQQEIIPTDVVLRTKDVYKTYSTSGGTIYAVRGVSFDIKQGEFIGLFGPSGSGKTTLLNIMAGLDKPDTGNVFIDGVSIQKLSESKLTALRRDKMGFVFQFYNLIPILNNEENVEYPAEIGGSSNVKQALPLLNSVQLQQFAKQYPNKLSGGQMQRVTIARSLINTPKILFADEPTGDLDSVTGREILNLLSKFNKENDTTIILVTHDKSLLSFCSRVINMTDGKIIP